MESGVSLPLAGRRAAIALTLAFALAAPMAAAGAMGIPALVTLAALIAVPRPALWRRLLTPEPPLLAAIAFLLWATITLLWSPSDAEQIGKVWAEVALGAGLLLAAAHLPEDMRRLPRAVFVGVTMVFAIFMAAESASGGVITAALTGKEAGSAGVLSDLTRGAAALIVLTPPAAVMGVTLGKPWRASGYIILFAMFAVSAGFEADANTVALLVTVAAFFIARRWPKAAVIAFGVGAAAWIVLFPLLVMLADPFVQPRRGDFPFSWEWRWEAWSYAIELIREKPWFGWGMDSARHFGEATTTMRGFVLPRMPLHTHSASLQIWLELGFVGVLLACAALVLGARRVARATVLPRRGAGAAAGAAVAIAFMASVSYGFWQEWLWATAILSAAACLIIAPGPAREARA